MMKIGEGYLLDGCRVWICDLVVIGTVAMEKEVKNNGGSDDFSRYSRRIYGAV